WSRNASLPTWTQPRCFDGYPTGRPRAAHSLLADACRRPSPQFCSPVGTRRNQVSFGSVATRTPLCPPTQARSNSIEGLAIGAHQDPHTIVLIALLQDATRLVQPRDEALFGLGDQDRRLFIA